ncbi:MAG TPA: hypothetical protein VGE41_06620 [Verrucomicrobiae bacterium]
MRLVCQCCGEKFEKPARSNPNICRTCDQLLEDDFPNSTAHLINAGDELAKTAGELSDAPPVTPAVEREKPVL